MILVVAALQAVSFLVFAWIWVAESNSGSEVGTIEATTLTAQVEERVIQPEVIFRVDVSYPDVVSSGWSSNAPGLFDSVVTAVSVTVGSQVDEGDLIMMTGDRPVIALEGSLPAYRDLRFELEGPDVVQLQRALQRLGYLDGVPSGVLDSSTQEAIAELYSDHGFTPPTSDVAVASQLATAQDRLASLRRERASAELVLADAQSPVPASERLALDLAIRDAERSLELAEITREIETAALAKRRDTAVNDLNSARSAEQLAADRLDQASAGTHPDTSLPPAAEEIATLEAELASRQSAVETLVDTLAEIDDETRVATLSLDGAVDSAAAQVALAKAASDDRLRPPDVRALVEEMDRLDAEIEAASTEVESLSAAAGISAPAAEFVFFPALPAQVVGVDAVVGEPPPIDAISTSSIGLRLVGRLSAGEVANISEASPALIGDFGQQFEAVVESVGDPGFGTEAGAGETVVLLADDLGPEMLGENLRATISPSATREAVLAVPFSAVFASADGETYVELGSGGRVEVSVHAEQDGWVEVEASDSRLAVGTEVVVGWRTSLATSEP